MIASDLTEYVEVVNGAPPAVIARGWARIDFGRGDDPEGIGGQAEPEQEMRARLRPDVDRSEIRPGMRLRWSGVEYDIIAAEPVVRARDPDGRWDVSADVVLRCVERRAARRGL